MASDPAEIFARVMALVEAGHKCDALDVVYNEVDEMLLKGDFGQAIAVLCASCNPEIRDRLPPSVHLSLLCITRPFGRGPLFEAREQVAHMLIDRGLSKRADARVADTIPA